MANVCQEFVKNAWRNDLCSNCFRNRMEHRLGTESLLDACNNNNNHRHLMQQQQNGYAKRSNGNRSASRLDVKGILKDSHNNENCGRRSSVVGFLEVTPQVIGYGGRDYEWDDDQESSDEPSDVDSLENFDLSMEEKAFTELTDTNTEYNAKNLNLLKLESNLSHHRAHVTTSSRTENDLNSTNKARNFICSNLYGDAVVEEEEKEDKPKAEPLVRQVLLSKPGCDTAPSHVGRRNVVRPSVMDLFNKEEPVTAAEFAAAASEKLSLGPNSVCSPYGIVSISSISSKMETGNSTALETPPPPSLDATHEDKQRPPLTLTIHNNNNNNNNNHICKDKNENEEVFDKAAETRTNREYEVVVRSCHYASANVANGVATPPLVSYQSTEKSEVVKAMTTSPTPLASPYSSTAILKGIPTKQEEVAKLKPPVIKPKPKILGKMSPLLTSSPSLLLAQSPPQLDELETSNCVTNDVNAIKDSETSDTVGETMTTCSSLDMTKNGSGSVDLGRRSTKRPAPRPPTDLPSPTSNQNVEDEVAAISLSSRDESDSLESCNGNKSTCELSETPKTEVLEIAVDVTNVDVGPAVAVAMEETSPYGVPIANGSSSSSLPIINVSGSYRDSPRDSGKSKKSKFSLKKLLKFGSSSAKEDHNLEQRRYKSERRAKLEIIHPIDLIQTSRTDLDTVSALPSSPDSSFGSNGSSSSDRPILTKMTTFGSPPISPGWTGNGNTSIKHVFKSEIQSPSGDHSLTDEQFEEQQRTESKNNENNSNSRNGNNSSTPQAPPRCRYVVSTPPQNGINNGLANKDRPVRPPPPARVLSCEHINSDVNNGDDEDPKEEVDIRNGTAELANENGDKSMINIMEYANLGDIRTSFVPRKPGRWPSGSIMELSDDVNGVDVLDYSSKIRESDDPVTYYSSPDNQEELYADANRSSLASDSTSSTPSEQDEKAKSTNGGGYERNGVKIYERVVLKNGGLEKVYTSSPSLVSPGGEISNGCNGYEASEEMTDGVWPRRTSCRLSMNKMKTVVHKNLEDNYGAVVAANHQSLTQIFEQVLLTHHTTISKVKMLEGAALHWTDFSLIEDSQVTVVGQKAFYSAIWKLHNLETTLMVTREVLCTPTQPTRNSCVLIPVAEFHNFIPNSYFAGSIGSGGGGHGVVWVMERMKVVDTVSSVADNLQLQRETEPEAYEREVCFILLQLINGLKHLQVLGIEEIEADLSDFLLVMNNNEVNYRLLILPQSSTLVDAYSRPENSREKKLSLGRGALEVMRLLFQEDSVDSLDDDVFGLVADILRRERADSLSQAKRLLEYLLWGPTNMNDSQTTVDHHQEQTFQRWLDLERANVLNNLTRAQSLWQIRLTTFEEYMLSFFVRTCAKSLRESSLLLQLKSLKYN